MAKTSFLTKLETANTETVFVELQAKGNFKKLSEKTNEKCHSTALSTFVAIRSPSDYGINHDRLASKD
eukprot:1194025-Prorocentrum_minimum.AAC.3